MKKSWVLILIIALVIALGIIITIIVTKHSERRINRFEFPTTMIVNNHTSHKYADTIAMVILNKIYQYDTMNINIYKMVQEMKNNQFEVAGYIQKNPFEPHAYNIYVKDKFLPVSIKQLLSHELIHLHQMELGDLIPLQDQNRIVYKGDTVVYSEVPYDKRAYEIEALSHEDKIQRILNKLLYSK